jgi:hypothetical protein
MVRVEELNGAPKHDWSLPSSGKTSRMKISDDDEAQKMAAAAAAPVLSVEEAERFIEGLREFDIEDVGCSG